MKRFSSALMIVALIVHLLLFCDKNNPSENNTNGIPVPEGYTLVWNDEFEGDQLSGGRWNYEVNGRGGGNHELQYYTDRQENVFINDGILVIQALKESYTGDDGQRDYTSGRITTRNKGDWKYGRLDICAKLPYGQGIWPAIWMMPTSNVYGGWASSGEIDIMELLGHEPNKVYGTLHYGGQWPANEHSGKSYTLRSGSFADTFHVFSVEWDTTEIRWYVDDEHVSSQTEWHTNSADFPAPFDQHFYLILNVAVGGNWPGNPNANTAFPQQMQVDYVRVFQRVE